MAAIGSLGRILGHLITVCFAKVRRLRMFARRRRLVRTRAQRWSAGSSNLNDSNSATAPGTWNRVGMMATSLQPSSCGSVRNAASAGPQPAANKPNGKEAEFEEEDEEEEDIDPRTLFPLWFAVLLLMSFVLAIATMFTLSEDWNYFDSAYFTIVTLATIGLGDLVPSNPSLLLCFSVVIILGLAILNIVVELSAFKLEQLFGNIQRRLISFIKKRNLK